MVRMQIREKIAMNVATIATNAMSFATPFFISPSKNLSRPTIPPKIAAILIVFCDVSK